MIVYNILTGGTSVTLGIQNDSLINKFFTRFLCRILVFKNYVFLEGGGGDGRGVR